MKNSFKILLAALVIFTISLSSCKRGGYGCPYELKMPKLTVVK